VDSTTKLTRKPKPRRGKAWSFHDQAPPRILSRDHNSSPACSLQSGTSATPAPQRRARTSVENRAKALLPQLKETTLDYKEIKGQQVTGYYCLITHKKPAKGQGPHGALAALAVGDDLLLTCEVAQKFETGPWQKLALDILRTATQKPLPATAAPAATRPAAPAK
jgi:hypothetical protein